ncbi:hypothetical protein [Rhizobium sp. SSA_523]|uniref:hypothetical protein n=1 Tax=Rhizobium sp. SSA_523 TaxID=2952477 RepID=UPI002091C8BE|nr:hypothetical protein [Rhizobium sp. SSA_523]MCO5733809.1 hypothetical protein [Rhizobium sp. SSA_523]WKC24917.1 hypothetical protein QTJ18_12985 [Rhizobium sp. SSA_523]
MNNVIKFEKRKPAPPPKQTRPPGQRPPWMGKPLAILIILVGLAAAWAYFHYVAPAAPGI